MKRTLFHKTLRLFFSARENILDNFKSRIFPIKNLDKTLTRKPTPELAIEPSKHEKNKFELQREFINEIIAVKIWYLKRYKWWNNAELY